MRFNPHGWRSSVTRYGWTEDPSLLPKLPKDIVKWQAVARPIVEGGIRRDWRTTPMWEAIYRDKEDLMVINGRQTYKSTYATDLLACATTSEEGISTAYITYDDSSKSAFSNQKLRVGTFITNPLLARFPRRGKTAGNVGEISLINNSTIYCLTDNYEYRHAEGKALTVCICDEAQYQDIQFLPKLEETMTATKGRLIILGIGGEAGSPYERLWKRSNQMEWIYDDLYWRESLRFGEHNIKGEEYLFAKTKLIVGDYLNTVLKGHWEIPQDVKDNRYFHGYHMPQQIFATIPLTIKSSIEQYGLKPRDAIEYKQKNNPDSIYKTHVLGTFYHAIRRPVTREMVLNCMEPYSYLSLLRPEEIADMKDIYQDEITVGMGVDWGSNPAKSATVIVILIHWKKSDRYQMVFLNKRPAENQMDQAEQVLNWFKRSKCDWGVGDLGYGAIQCKLIQDGGSNRLSGKRYEGVGSDRFVGSRMIGDETKQYLKYEKKIDEHGEIANKITMDKTSEIQKFVDLLEVYISHPTHPIKNDYKRPKLIIPYHYEKQYETDWLIDDYTDITRRDLEITDDVAVTEDRRLKARKQYNHPRDSTMATIYAVRALNLDKEWHWVSA